MRIMSVNVEYFLWESRGFFSKINPFRWMRKGVVQQYINIQKLKQLKRQIMPDLMMAHQIRFIGRGQVPQVNMMNDRLIQDGSAFNSYLPYKDKKPYSTALFGDLVSRTLMMTPNTYCFEVDYGEVTLLSINLSKRRKTRKEQIKFIESRINRNIQTKYIVVGEFNLRNNSELSSVMNSCSLFLISTPNNYPRHNPKHQLCRILSNSDIRVFDIRVIDGDFSNHLPIVFDIEL